MQHRSGTKHGHYSLAIIALSACCAIVQSDFLYTDFRDAGGLQLNGHAATSSCGDNAEYNYFVLHGINDVADAGAALGSTVTEDSATITEHTVSTATERPAPLTQLVRGSGVYSNATFQATFPERAAAEPDPYRPCPPRLRLTPARPDTVGSALRREPVAVTTGFQTGFTFQITDHARACRHVRDSSLSALLHKSCVTHGGDGFAFLITLHENASAVMGAGAQGLGYAGIPNALVVEFDTWYNPEAQYEDLIYDHVEVHIAPAGGALTSDASTRVSYAHLANLADGLLHSVKITYFPYLKYDLVEHMLAGDALEAYLLDAGENRRIGTLVIHVDNMTTPLITMPINLNIALALPQDQAFVGFTAATGRAWEKHDIIDWYYCETASCTVLRGDPALLKYRPR